MADGGLLVGSLIGCDGMTVEDPPQMVAYETLDEARHFAVTEPGTQVFRSEGAWTALWEETWSVFEASGVKTPPPEVDFTQHMVLAVFWGGGFSGCSSGLEAIEAVWQRDAEVEVWIGSLPDLGPCDALVYPVQMVRVPRSERTVVFRGEVPGT